MLVIATDRVMASTAVNLEIAILPKATRYHYIYAYSVLGQFLEKTVRRLFLIDDRMEMTQTFRQSFFRQYLAVALFAKLFDWLSFLLYGNSYFSIFGAT